MISIGRFNASKYMEERDQQMELNCEAFNRYLFHRIGRTENQVRNRFRSLLKKAQVKYPNLISKQLIDQLVAEKQQKLKLSPQTTPKTDNIILATPKSDELQPRNFYPKPKKVHNGQQKTINLNARHETKQVKTQLRDIAKEEISNSPTLRINSDIDFLNKKKLQNFKIQSQSIEVIGPENTSNLQFVYQMSSSMENLNSAQLNTNDLEETNLK